MGPLAAFANSCLLGGRNSTFLLTCHRPKIHSVRTTRRKGVIKNAASPIADDTQDRTRYDDDGSRVIPVHMFAANTADQLIAGVYGILDKKKKLVYVGMSRDVRTSLAVHINSHGEHVAFVRVMTFQMPMALEMTRVADSWLRESDSIPLGNEENWYEADEELSRQASTISETRDVGSNDMEIISPFESDPLASQETIDKNITQLEFNAANVDLVLDEVRPFLLLDGGNVSVQSVDVSAGRVEVVLEGACGSCASAGTTMKMGIEKALRKRFGDGLKEVLAVQIQNSEGETSVQACERALDTIRDTIRGLGAEVAVLEVDEDEAIVSLSGPRNLQSGIERLLREKVSEIEVVTFE